MGKLPFDLQLPFFNVFLAEVLYTAINTGKIILLELIGFFNDKEHYQDLRNENERKLTELKS